jgi:hypothetical protein
MLGDFGINSNSLLLWWEGVVLLELEIANSSGKGEIAWTS